MSELKEVKTEKPLPKRSHPIVRIIAFAVTIALVLGAVYLVANRDRLNFDALKRWFNYRNLAKSDTERGEPFPYQSGDSMTLVQCNGDLLAVSETGIRLYSPGGTAYVEDTVTLTHPACQVNGKAAVVYDAGGTFLRVYKNRNQVFELEDNTAAILSARLNQSGYLAVVTRSSGYKGVVTVYDPSYRPLLDLRLSSSFVLDAIVSPDNRSVLAVTAGQENRLFSSSLALYSLSDIDPKEPTPTAVLSLGNQLPLNLVWDKDGIRVLGEYAAIAANSSLEETGLAQWSGRHLKRSSLLGDNSFAVLTGKYRAGSQTTLQIIGPDGEVKAEREETRPVLALSAAGKYIGVLTGDSLEIYTQDLALYASTPVTQGASQMVLLPDGSAYLATKGTAWLYLP